MSNDIIRHRGKREETTSAISSSGYRMAENTIKMAPESEATLKNKRRMRIISASADDTKWIKINSNEVKRKKII